MNENKLLGLMDITLHYWVDSLLASSSSHRFSSVSRTHLMSPPVFNGIETIAICLPKTRSSEHQRCRRSRMYFATIR